MRTAYLLSFIMFLFLNGCAFIFGPTDLDDLILDNPYSTPYLHLKIPEEIREQLFKDTLLKNEYMVNAAFNDHLLPGCIINVRGYSALGYRRKNFELKLAKELTFSNEQPFCFSHAYLNSLEGDTGMMNNWLGYTIMSDLGFFFSRFFLSELYINKNSSGLYLIIERPANALRRTKPTTEFIIRRRYNIDYELKYYKEAPYAIPFTDYKKYYMEIYSLAGMYSGKKLYTRLKEIVDIDQYMELLGLYTFLKNGDYTDEIYFYASPSPGNSLRPFFHVSGWDLDELFQGPHRNESIPGKLVYCGENALDRTIAEDNFLYLRFLEILIQLLEIQFNESIIDNYFTNLEDALYPYLSREDILDMQFNLPEPNSKTWSGVLNYYSEKKEMLKARRLDLLTEAKLQYAAIQ